MPAVNSVDLHCHSNASDGLLTPAALVRCASERGLQILGLTDHDTTSGIEEAQAEATNLGLEVIAGVELSSEVDGMQAHILGYFIDPKSTALKNEFAWMIESRRARITRICEQLAAAGYKVDVDDVFALAGEGTVGRPHVARALVNRGYADSVSDAFAHFLTSGRVGYVQSKKIEPERAIAVIQQAGGVAALAHPWSTGNPEAAVQLLRPAGLSGLEAYYLDYEPPVQDQLAELGTRCGLILTGGSDFHGESVKRGRLGEARVPPDTVERLRTAAHAGFTSPVSASIESS
jgi:3',5'-nucleoside bisphosphate phosphatase